MLCAQSRELQERVAFRVKYAIQDAVYLEGGRNAGLAEGMTLEVKRPVSAEAGGQGPGEGVVAVLVVSSVADSSAVCDVQSSSGELHAGDLAYLSKADAEAVAVKRAMSRTREYPQVITFSGGDPLDEEQRAAVPKPPLPEVNRARGRIGFDYSGLQSRDGSGMRSHQLGLVLRADITGIGGTHWSLAGYWRGRLDSHSAGTQETLNELMNRTYHLALTYDNPESNWVAGAGRLQLPWATSLTTLDGGYLGRRIGKHTTTGIFGGSTPDPTSWNYNPDRRLGGTFVNVQAGSFDSFRITTTTGAGISSIAWQTEKQFVFAENGFFYKRFFALYHSAEADRPDLPDATGRHQLVLSRSYATLRLQPHQRVAFDLNHSYFRDLPTFDPRLIGTGLVDPLLSQGFSGGVRVELPQRITVYSNLGRSSQTGDARNSLNQMYGVTLGSIWKTGVRADVRYSEFDGSFGRGTYRSLSLSRNFGENVRWELQGGRQLFFSAMTADNRSHYVMTTVEAAFARHYFIQGGFTMQRGQLQSYNQWFSTLGYRFDSRGVR